jgi:hypothetical protein
MRIGRRVAAEGRSGRPSLLPQALAEHSLNNQGSVEGLSIAAVQPVRTTLSARLWLMPEKQQRGEVGDLFSPYVRFP